MKAEETNLGDVADLLRWALLRMYFDFDYTTGDLERLVTRELSGIEHFSEKQLKEAWSYCNAQDIIEKGIADR